MAGRYADFVPGGVASLGESATARGGISWGGVSFGEGGFDTNEGESTIEWSNVMLERGIRLRWRCEVHA